MAGFWDRLGKRAEAKAREKVRRMPLRVSFATTLTATAQEAQDSIRRLRIPNSAKTDLEDGGWRVYEYEQQLPGVPVVAEDGRVMVDGAWVGTVKKSERERALKHQAEAIEVYVNIYGNGYTDSDGFTLKEAQRLKAELVIVYMIERQ